MMLSITSRRDLKAFVNDVVGSSHARLVHDQKLEFGQGMLKSYVVEQHQHDTDGDRVDTKQRFARIRELTSGLGVISSQTEDPHLFLIHLAEGGQEEDMSLVVDTADWRYWRFHTASSTELTDKFISKLATETPSLDRAWLSGRYLNTLAGVGEPYKIVINFDTEKLLSPVPEGRSQFGIASGRYFDAESGVDAGRMIRAGDLPSSLDANEHSRSVSLDLRDYRHLRQAYRELQGVEYFANALNLTRMDIRYALNNSAEYSNERVYDWGKVTASGTSGVAHLDFVDLLVSDYRRTIVHVEQECGLRRETDKHGTRLDGQPVNIEYRPIPEFETFVFNLFSGNQPFRLYGIPRFRRRNYAVVNAIDLHVKQPLRFEVAETYMTVVLREHGCGNSIARLYTNLLRHYDANALIYGRDKSRSLLL